MTRNKHIKRNYNANKVKIIRYDKDDFHLEVFKFDKSYDIIHTATKGEYDKNGAVTYWFDGMTCLYSEGNSKLKLGFWFPSDNINNNYRVEVLYGNTYRNTKDEKRDGTKKCQLNIKLNGKNIINNTTLKSNDVSFNRHYQYINSTELGLNYLEYEFSPNTAFYGIIIRKYDIYEAHRHSKNNDKLTMIKASVDNTNEFRVNTMKCELMYYHNLDEKLPLTDPNANLSNFIFDYRDEINLKVINNNGVWENVFGGYISTITVDDNLTKMTLNCVDRLADLDRRYCLSEIYMKGRTDDGTTLYSTSYDFVKNYKYWSAPLDFLLKSCEVPLKTNVKSNKPLVNRKELSLAEYGKNKYNKFTTNGIDTTIENDYVMIRNDSNIDNQHSIVIYDAGNNPKNINNYPNLYITYGMGKEVYEEKVKETTKISSGTKQSVRNQADKITTKTGNAAIKPIFNWISSKIGNENKSKFYQDSAKTLSRKLGNDCCKTELLLDMLNYKNVSNLKYVYTYDSKSKKGHVFAKVDKLYLDPSISNGYGTYNKKYGNINNAKTASYPDKPSVL